MDVSIALDHVQNSYLNYCVFEQSKKHNITIFSLDTTKPFFDYNASIYPLDYIYLHSNITIATSYFTSSRIKKDHLFFMWDIDWLRYDIDKLYYKEQKLYIRNNDMQEKVYSEIGIKPRVIGNFEISCIENIN